MNGSSTRIRPSRASRWPRLTDFFPFAGKSELRSFAPIKESSKISTLCASPACGRASPQRLARQPEMQSRVPVQPDLSLCPGARRALFAWLRSLGMDPFRRNRKIDWAAGGQILSRNETWRSRRPELQARINLRVWRPGHSPGAMKLSRGGCLFRSGRAALRLTCRSRFQRLDSGPELLVFLVSLLNHL